MDSNGMCYDIVDLAEEHGQDEVANLFKAMEAKGPVRQEITLNFAGKPPKKFVMANSKDDWKLFKKEVGDHFGLPANKVKIIVKGDANAKKLQWNLMRADRGYNVVSK